MSANADAVTNRNAARALLNWRIAALRRSQFLDSLDDPSPRSSTVQVARFKQLVCPHGRVDRRLVAALADQEAGLMLIR